MVHDGTAIRRVTKMDAAVIFDQIALVHRAEIRLGALPLLGLPFLAELYRRLAARPEADVWVAINEGRVVGFAAASTNVTLTYRRVILGGFVPLVSYALIGVASQPRVLPKLYSVFRCMARSTLKESHSAQAKERAELLAIAVASSMRQRGIATGLVHVLEESLVARFVREYFVSTNIQEHASNAFYRAIGFAAYTTYVLHDIVVQEYKKTIDTGE